jgi:pimeloyl-ACP methyl ester carboxylesterase
MFRFLLLSGVLIFISTFLNSQPANYPHEVKFITLDIERQPVRMAYMDVRPGNPNGKAVLLLHGKNFNGYYWKDVIRFLADSGYRVVVPDQVGWGRSDKPNIHYSFHLLANNTRQLLDTLNLQKVHVIGHSMGGMLAARFTLMYPQNVDRVVLENPIGLEDYKTFIPWQPLDKLFQKEMNANYASYKKYQQTYYPVWKPEYEQYVAAQAEGLGTPGFSATAWVNALTYQMIYEQPVVYEFRNISRPALIIVGLEDRTVVGKDQLSKDSAALYGQYPMLGRWLNKEIRGSRLVEFQGVGHIPHIQWLDPYKKEVLEFFK